MKAGHILVGLGAGLISALLLATLVSRSSFAILLVLLSPLPLFIAGFGWSWISALVGSLVAAAVLAFVTNFNFGFSYLLSVGGPAVWISYVALLGRPASESADPEVQRQGGTEWYPVGSIIAWLAIAAGLQGALFVLLSGGFSLEGYMAANRPSIATAVDTMDRLVRRPAATDPAQREALVNVMAMILPVATAAMTLLILVVNTWIGGRVAARSGQSARPWPDIAAFELPRTFLYATIALLAASFVASGVLAMIVNAFLVAFVIAYMLQGLAVIHYATRGIAGRFAIVTFAYALLFLFQGVTAVLYALVGLAEPMVRLRERARRRLQNTPPPPPGPFGRP